jgi:hypothetical protein
MKERELYGEVALWFERRLEMLYPSWRAIVHNTSQTRLSAFLSREGIAKAYPGSEAFEIEVDLTGILRRGSKFELAFVECKTAAITLKDIGQILGYSRVALPRLAVILSPGGLSQSVGLLLNTYNRTDILEYGTGKRLKVGVWDLAKKQVDPGSVYPPGELG